MFVCLYKKGVAPMGLKLYFAFVFYKDAAPLGLLLCSPSGFEIRFRQSFRKEIRALRSSEKSAVQTEERTRIPPEKQ
jgi:hypothetical protein